MARMSAEATPARRPRPPRTLVQKLAPVVLGFEAIVVFLVGLTIFGLRQLPEGVEQWWAIVAGAVLALACIVIAGMITKPWALTAGWVIQAVVALSAFFVPSILLVVLIFGGMWAYATIGGARLDARRPAEPTTETQTESE
ncbi:allophanate hydrolase [Microbacterium sp. Root1433D1]|nr:allophanate hydrolase [Microbacterium sp. Root322]KQY75997.1 allophanate hydrolase [Microbacterium sp. Root1433D1]